MLQNLRDKAQGWIAWVIMGMICVTFVLFGAESVFSSSTDRGQIAVAKVNGTKITAQDLDLAYQQFIRQPANESARLLDPAFVKKELLQSLIDDTILLQAAVKAGMQISPALIQSTLSSIPFLSKDGQFSLENYQQFLQHAQFTDRSFKALLRDSLIKQQLRLGLMQTSFSLPDEFNDLVKFFLQKRDFRYVTFARKAFEKDIQIQKEEIKKYFDEHRQDFMTSEKISLEYVRLTQEDLLNKYQPSEKDLQNFYKQNIALFKEPEKIHVKHILIALPQNADEAAEKQAIARVTEIQDKLKAGVPFEDLARDYSEDKASAQSGGELDWFSRGEMVPKFENAAFALEKPDQLSKPVRTQFGFHLIKLIQKQTDKQRTFDQAKGEILQKVKQEWAQEQLANMADELATLAYDYPDSLLPAADKLSLPIQKTELFSQNEGSKDPFLQQPAVLAAAFSPSVKEDKNNSDIIKIDEENYVVVRAAKYIPAKQKTLEEVSSTIEDTLILEKSEALAHQQAQRAYNSFKNAKGVSAGYTWQEEKGVLRTNTSNPDLLEAVFSMPRAQNGEAVFKVAKLENGDSVLIWLMSVTDGEETSLSEEQKENYDNAFAQNLGQLEYALYATHLFKEAKVKKFEDKI